MIDAKTILDTNMQIPEAVRSLFTPASVSKLTLVRDSAAFHRGGKASSEIISTLKELGYLVRFNLMQSAGKSDELIEHTSNLISSWENLDVLYFADSLEI